MPTGFGEGGVSQAFNLGYGKIMQQSGVLSRRSADRQCDVAIFGIANDQQQRTRAPILPSGPELAYVIRRWTTTTRRKDDLQGMITLPEEQQ
jgi:hypothetical protein